MPDNRKNSLPNAPRLLLAGSGGGHVRQLLDLKMFWSKYDYRFVTEDTSLGHSIAQDHSADFVAHFAAGQLKLFKPVKFLHGMFANFAQSWRIIRRNKPEYVLTTGAGSMMFVILFARMFGAKIVLVDSFARFQSPSLFARIAGPLAHLRISQSAISAEQWPGALTFDPLLIETPPRPDKEHLLFATVGATLPFDRLTDYVLAARESGAIKESVILQIGESTKLIQPMEGVECVRELPFDEVHAALARADLVICHGGTGSLITALQHQCRVIAVPRLFALGEHYDNHQLEITEVFAARGLIQVARNEQEFTAALERARDMDPPKVRTDYTQLAEHLDRFIANQGDSDLAVTNKRNC